jgi:hypothetical protein
MAVELVRSLKAHVVVGRVDSAPPERSEPFNVIVRLKLLKGFCNELVEIGAVFPDFDKRCNARQVSWSNAELEMLDQVFDEAFGVRRRLAVWAAIVTTDTRSEKEDAITAFERLSQPQWEFYRWAVTR